MRKECEAPDSLQLEQIGAQSVRRLDDNTENYWEGVVLLWEKEIEAAI